MAKEDTDELTPERLARLKHRWYSDVDLKLDRLVRFADAYEPFLKLQLERERQRVQMRHAIIEKTLGALIWSAVIGLVALAWSGTKAEFFAILDSMRGHGK